MKKSLTHLKSKFEKDIIWVKDLSEIESLFQQYLGKNGELKEILKGIKDLSNEEKKEIWVEANSLKEFIEGEISKQKEVLQKQEYANQEKNEEIDVTLQFPIKNKWHIHPISIIIKMIEETFTSLGFKIEDGPQIETEEFNFDKLNIPDNHPARDVWDTFWIHDSINQWRAPGHKLLLRTHTSPVQVRTMLKWEIPIKVITTGRVYRYEQEDARHTCNFYQFEGLMIGKWVTFGDLKWTLETAMKKFFGEDTHTRLRPSIFPFTEPSAEVDVTCQICKGKGTGCRMCSESGWVELLWAGMVHPNVLEYCGIDPEVYSGFAFGMGVDRIAAQRYGVSSSRMFYQNKLKLNEQFY